MPPQMRKRWRKPAVALGRCRMKCRQGRDSPGAEGESQAEVSMLCPQSCSPGGPKAEIEALQLPASLTTGISGALRMLKTAEAQEQCRVDSWRHRSSATVHGWQPSTNQPLPVRLSHRRIRVNSLVSSCPSFMLERINLKRLQLSAKTKTGSMFFYMDLKSGTVFD